jgi:hypothetical protein
MHRYIPLLNGTLRVRKSKFLKVSKGYFFKVIPPLGHVQNFFKWAIRQYTSAVLLIKQLTFANNLNDIVTLNLKKYFTPNVR